MKRHKPTPALLYVSVCLLACLSVAIFSCTQENIKSSSNLKIESEYNADVNRISNALDGEDNPVVDIYCTLTDLRAVLNAVKDYHECRKSL